MLAKTFHCKKLISHNFSITVFLSIFFLIKRCETNRIIFSYRVWYKWKLLGETVEVACYPRPRWFIAESFASIHVHRRCTPLFFPRFGSSIEDMNHDTTQVVKKLRFPIKLVYRKDLRLFDLSTHATTWHKSTWKIKESCFLWDLGK